MYSSSVARVGIAEMPLRPVAAREVLVFLLLPVAPMQHTGRPEACFCCAACHLPPPLLESE